MHVSYNALSYKGVSISKGTIKCIKHERYQIIIQIDVLKLNLVWKL